MVVAHVCIAVLGLMVFLLGFNVSLNRRKARVGAGLPDDPTSPLFKASRAHGNTCEYAPAMMVLIYVVASLNPSPWVLGLIVLATLSRCLLVVGILTSKTLASSNPWRFIGALGTYIFGGFLAVALLFSVLSRAT